MSGPNLTIPYFPGSPELRQAARSLEGDTMLQYSVSPGGREQLMGEEDRLTRLGKYQYRLNCPHNQITLYKPDGTRASARASDYVTKLLQECQSLRHSLSNTSSSRASFAVDLKIDLRSETVTISYQDGTYKTEFISSYIQELWAKKHQMKQQAKSAGILV